MGLFGGKSEDELRVSGMPATARVTYLDDTGKRREGGTQARLRIQLKIDSGSARGRDLEQTKWVPVTRMPHVGEVVSIRFDPDDVDDWAWSDAAMDAPATAAGAAAPAAPAPASQPVIPPEAAAAMKAVGIDMEQLQQVINTAMAHGNVTVEHYEIDATGAMPAPGGPGGGESATDMAERLRKTDALLEQGLLTPDEHRELRRRIIDSI